MFIEQLWLNSIYISLFFNQQSSKMLQIFTEEPKFSKIKIPCVFLCTLSPRRCLFFEALINIDELQFSDQAILVHIYYSIGRHVVPTAVPSFVYEMETLVAFVGYHSYTNNTRVRLHPAKLQIFFPGRHFVDTELKKIYVKFLEAHKSSPAPLCLYKAHGQGASPRLIPACPSSWKCQPGDPWCSQDGEFQALLQSS